MQRQKSRSRTPKKIHFLTAQQVDVSIKKNNLNDFFLRMSTNYYKQMTCIFFHAQMAEYFPHKGNIFQYILICCLSWHQFVSFLILANQPVFNLMGSYFLREILKQNKIILVKNLKLPFRKKNIVTCSLSMISEKNLLDISQRSSLLLSRSIQS